MIEWFTANWGVIATILLGVLVLASIVVKTTKTEKDDIVLNWIINLLDNFSVAKTDSDKKLIAYAKQKMAEEEKG